MQTQVKQLYELGVLDASFIGLDSTPVMANTKQNNPKSFAKNKFSKENHPKSDPDCTLGVHSASNQHNERKYEFYWGYKNHVRVDCITGLPLCEQTTTADSADSAVALDILKRTNGYLSVEECMSLAIRPMMSRRFITLFGNFTTESVSFLSTREIRKILPDCHAAHQSAKQVLPCIGTENLQRTEKPDRNIVVPIKGPPICTIVPAHISAFTRKVRPPAAQNMRQFQTTTGFPFKEIR